MHTRCVPNCSTGMQDTNCTGHGLGPWAAGQDGSCWQHGILGSWGCKANKGQRRGRQPASPLTREGGAPGRPLSHPHAHCQLHVGRCPDAFASPCASPACPQATAQPRTAASKGKVTLGHAGTHGRANPRARCPASTQREAAHCGSMGSGGPGHPSFRRRLQRWRQSTASRSYSCAEIQRWEVPYCSLCSILS